MSIRPKVITMEEVAKQMPFLIEKKKELTLIHADLANRFGSIESILKENQELEASAKAEIEESVNLFLDEWSRIRECYPEVRLGVLMKTLAFISASKKDNTKI